MARTRSKGLEALAGLPNWPLMLTALQAAANVGLDPDAFDAAVGAKEIPGPVTLRGESLWNRRQLDRRFDDLSTPVVGATDTIADALAAWAPR